MERNPLRPVVIHMRINDPPLANVFEPVPPFRRMRRHDFAMENDGSEDDDLEIPCECEDVNKSIRSAESNEFTVATVPTFDHRTNNIKKVADPNPPEDEFQ